jgi:hypothetical protein
MAVVFLQAVGGRTQMLSGLFLSGSVPPLTFGVLRFLLGLCHIPSPCS